MKRKHLLWIAPWIAFGLGACATVQRTETSKACAEWRWIAVRSPQAETCPEIPGWEKPRPLFDPKTAVKADRNLDGYEEKEEGIEAETTEALRQLDRFCVYETGKKLGRVPIPPDGDGKLVRVDQDCAAISVAGTKWVPFSDSFLHQAGKPGEQLSITNQRGVRLAFLDTQPTGEGAPKRPTEKLTSEHGYTLAHMARNLICSPEDTDRCAALITTRLALPIQKFNPRSRAKTEIRPKQGGVIGTQGDLANAIRDEVNAWREHLGEKEAPQKLVINLSVAWDGDLFDGLDEREVAELSAGTQAVYWALRYASSFNDVLVLAAAGNACKTCEKKSVGPLLPAAWEDSPPIAGASGGPPKQLVYAVGGVDAAGKPLANARENGMPCRAAYGVSGVVPALPAGNSTHMYTGTSVATAVVSSIAAIVWDTLPNRRPDEIMSLIDRSGDDLTALDFNVRTNFFFRASNLAPGEPPPVRRISLCPALKAACAELGTEPGCPLKPETKCRTWEPATFASVPPRLRQCHPWVHTQPPEDPCPICEPPRLKN